MLVLGVLAVLMGALVAVRYGRVEKLERLDDVEHLFKSEDLSRSERTVTASSENSEERQEEDE